MFLNFFPWEFFEGHFSKGTFEETGGHENGHGQSLDAVKELTNHAVAHKFVLRAAVTRVEGREKRTNRAEKHSEAGN